MQCTLFFVVLIYYLTFYIIFWFYVNDSVNHVYDSVAIF